MSESQESLLIRQEMTLSHIQSALTKFQALSVEGCTKAQVQTRLSTLDANWNKFKNGHDKLTRTRLSEEIRANKYFTDDMYATCEETYVNARSLMLTSLEELRSNQSFDNSIMNQSISHSSHLRSLPKITLPKFSGNYHGWRPFHDLFTSMIHSSSELSAVEKFYYLKSSLSGEALQCISNLPVSSENFAPAWSLLCTQYENSRMLINSHLDAIFELPRLQRKSSSDLKNLLAVVKESLGALEALGSPVKQWDHIIVYMVVRRLDSSSHEAWELCRSSSKKPATFSELEIFLSGRIQAMESVESRACSSNPSKKATASSHVATSAHQKRPVEVPNKLPFQSNNVSCSLCSLNHYVSSCGIYNDKNLDQKHAFLVSKNLCFNCLGPHRVAHCRSSKTCRHCKSRHHSSIHGYRLQPEASSSQNTTPSGGNLPPETVSNHAISAALSSHSEILLATALVRIKSAHGVSVTARALLDQGSQITLISEELVQKLHLQRQKGRLNLIGIGALQSGPTKGLVQFTLCPHFESSFECSVSAYVLSKLTTQLPSCAAKLHNTSYLKGIQLADPNFMVTSKIDLIIGADLYGYLLEGQILKGDINSPVAQLTSLGWILSGILNHQPNSTSSRSVQAFKCQVDYALDELLQRFWTQEEGTTKTTILSPDEQECENHFQATHRRDSSGRYIVRLPFKRSPKELGDSRKPAERMLVKILQKSESNTRFFQLYSNFLKEYQSLGHMVPASPAIYPAAEYYLPHHGVLRESSTTTKLRVVFNGSCKTSSGVSLNDLLHTGPKLQLEISDVITRWRQYRFVFSADIEKMFRQVMVDSRDWAYQKILWKSSLSSSLVPYYLTTVTYGLGPAPYLSNRVLKQLAADEGSNYPLAVEILHKSTYVDDTFGGADSLEEAQATVIQLDKLCTAGGFHLQKWTANNSSVISSISSDRCAIKTAIQLQENPSVCTLGICWQPEEDSFVFSSPFLPTSSSKPTKRSILSNIARLFDPLGWISPVTIQAKILMQDIWLSKVDWDEVVNEDLADRWSKFITDLDNINKISIPRWVGVSSKNLGVEIHGFSDASEHAMATVIYLRIITDLDSSSVHLIEAKTKVAPTKRQTIPRLELNAAVILTNRVAHLQASLNLHHVSTHLWTDSSVALTWIKGHPSRWKDFVSNRVLKIQEALPQAKWHHVPGKCNPSDCASRGLSVQQLIDHPLWWHGPDWLVRHSSSWPASDINVGDINLEERAPHRVINIVCRREEKPIWALVSKFSKLSRLLKVTAICRRFCTKNCKKSIVQQPLNPTELDYERKFWIKLTQNSYFQSEIKALKRGQQLPSSHPLSKFTPFIDAFGLLRVGGRLHNALIDPDAKHPSLLPSNSAITNLLIAEAHDKTLHGGTQVMCVYLWQYYWILGGRSAIKAFNRRCVRCAKIRGVTARQLMGQLPSNRTTPARPFFHSGVDYAGPLSIKTWRGRGAKQYKGYIALFVCLSTSAVHLEVASDSSVDGFLAAFKRFVARRGVCSTLTSDCGTNFIGADAELKRLFTQSTEAFAELAAVLANDGTQWKFNPPSAPHFGGKWEASVKSVKFHLRRIIGDTVLTFEELSTLLAQIEAVLNSRPLCPLSDDPSDVNAITPAHFLIGSTLNAVPEPSVLNLPVSRLSRLQLIQQMIESFWKRWSNEYLQRFKSISKWKQQENSLKKGSLVLIADERYPPTKWPLGRILEVHPGPDGLVRVATVRTASSTLKRPVVKLCPLPVDDHNDLNEESPCI